MLRLATSRYIVLDLFNLFLIVQEKAHLAGMSVLPRGELFLRTDSVLVKLLTCFSFNCLNSFQRLKTIYVTILQKKSNWSILSCDIFLAFLKFSVSSEIWNPLTSTIFQWISCFLYSTYYCVLTWLASFLHYLPYLKNPSSLYGIFNESRLKS